MEGLWNAEGGERGIARGVSRESTDPVRSREVDEGGLRARSTARGSSKTRGRGVGSGLRGPWSIASGSSPCLMLAGGDGGGGPTGVSEGRNACGSVFPWRATSVDTTCMTVVLLKTETVFESRPRVSRL